jgi:hypothetical protein
MNVSVKYIPKGNTKIVIGGVTYQNKDGKQAVLPVDKLGKEELERLLKGNFIEKQKFDESGNAREKKEEKPEPKSREELLKKAAELGITVTDAMTDEEIQKLIADKKKA